MVVVIMAWNVVFFLGFFLSCTGKLFDLLIDYLNFYFILPFILFIFFIDLISGAVYYCNVAGMEFLNSNCLQHRNQFKYHNSEILSIKRQLLYFNLHTWYILDPCGHANSTQLFEPYARFQNCPHNSNGLCDRYITPQWYRVDDIILTQCPQLLSCGTLYPVWMNGKYLIFVKVRKQTP